MEGKGGRILGVVIEPEGMKIEKGKVKGEG